jgi:hypothetical protein
VAAERCCVALRAAAGGEARGRRVATAHLRRIYGIRLGRKPSAVVGGERLLSDLDAFPGSEVTLVALEQQGWVYCMLFDAEVSQLVTCFVGKDRRLVEVA